MFKRKNKLWRCLALVVAFCMGPTLTCAAFEAMILAPALILPDAWYEGETSLAIELKKHNDEAVAYAYAEAWEEAIDAVTVTPAKEGLTWELNSEKTHLVLSGFETTGESITKIVITTDGNVFYPAEWEDALAQEAKDAGSLHFTGTAVAGKDAEITVTSEDADWKAALTTEGVVKVDGEHATVSVEGNVLYVPVDLESSLEGTVTVTVEKQYYMTEEVEIAVVAPTKADTDALTPSVKYSAAEFEVGDTAYVESDISRLTVKDRQARFGKALIALPGIGVNGSVLTWKIDSEPVTANTPISLKRPDSAADGDAVIAVTCEAAKPGYKTAVKTWNLPVYKINSGAALAATDIEIGDSISLTAQLKFADVYEGTLAAALYSDEEKLLHVDLSNACETVSVALETGDAKYLKLMWLNMDTLVPYCTCVPIHIP